MRRTSHARMLTLMLTGTLTGCAGVGKQDFACPGYPEQAPVPVGLGGLPADRRRRAAASPSRHRRWRNDAPRIEDELFMETP